MKLAVVLLFVSASILSTEAIQNGETYQTAPYMARIQYLTQPVGGTGGQGGGAVISRRHILTTASVLQPQYTVLIVWIGGVTRGTQRNVPYQRRQIHPSYGASPRVNDLGIITLNADIVFDRFVQPIALPATALPYINEQVKVLGFGGFPGNTIREQLEAAFMRVVPHTRCQTQFPQQIVAQQFCSEDTLMRSDFCSDDIGGPAVTTLRGQEVLVGIASVFRCVAANQPSIPSLFTRIHEFRAWINTETGV